ncbi:MAG: GNAT family protein [Spirochaetaceae bacterium]|jgi:RimJ/RimL family protein N-acetyltransferase|nr:GNAT family protein [Spirochaetaceae bacterium]
MAYYKKLIGETCYLSPISEEDSENWVRWLNDSEVTLPLGDEVFQVIGPQKAQEMVRESQSKGDKTFTIVDNNSDKAIGRIMLFDIHQIYQSAMMGIFIGEGDYWSRGYGSEAINLLLDYAFNLLNLHYISLGVFEYNQRAYNCYKKIGFKEIGRRREARPVGDKLYDVILMDILATEYNSVYVKGLL